MYEKLIENPVDLIGIVDNTLVFKDENDDFFCTAVSDEDVEFFYIGDTHDKDEFELIALEDAPQPLQTKIDEFLKE